MPMTVFVRPAAAGAAPVGVELAAHATVADLHAAAAAALSGAGAAPPARLEFAGEALAASSSALLADVGICPEAEVRALPGLPPWRWPGGAQTVAGTRDSYHAVHPELVGGAPVGDAGWTFAVRLARPNSCGHMLILCCPDYTDEMSRPMFSITRRGPDFYNFAGPSPSGADQHFAPSAPAGTVRALRYDAQKRISVLATTWCSKASARQRGGRAGRVMPGTAYRLFPRDFRMMP
eukprot:gene2089-7835_t